MLTKASIEIEAKNPLLDLAPLTAVSMPQVKKKNVQNIEKKICIDTSRTFLANLCFLKLSVCLVWEVYTTAVTIPDSVEINPSIESRGVLFCFLSNNRAKKWFIEVSFFYLLWIRLGPGFFVIICKKELFAEGTSGKRSWKKNISTSTSYPPGKTIHSRPHLQLLLIYFFFSWRLRSPHPQWWHQCWPRR